MTVGSGNAAQRRAEMMRATAGEIEMLRRILEKRQPSLVPLIENPKSMRDHDRRAIVEVLAFELAERGLGEDSEPNDYGIQVEHLMDLVNEAGSRTM
jgi:hypothetical protein